MKFFYTKGMLEYCNKFKKKLQKLLQLLKECIMLSVG